MATNIPHGAADLPTFFHIYAKIKATSNNAHICVYIEQGNSYHHTSTRDVSLSFRRQGRKANEIDRSIGVSNSTESFE